MHCTSVAVLPALVIWGKGKRTVGDVAMKKKKSGVALMNGLRFLLAPVDSVDTDRSKNDGWFARTTRQKSCPSTIAAGVFWWLMSVILGLLISRLH